MGSHRDIVWRIALTSPPDRVFDMIATDEGRARFWAERTHTGGDVIRFHFPNGWVETSPVLAADRPHRFELTYFGMATRFDLEPEGTGTILTLTVSAVPGTEFDDVHAGWVSVLMALKAACDHNVDLRNHDPQRSWDQGFCDN